MKHIFLASKSPRRKEILKNIKIDFSIVESDYNEKISSDTFSYEQIELIAKNKVFGALNNVTDDGFILGADTVVVLNNNILLKPKNKDAAFNILKSLSNKQHFVVTSHCLLDIKTKKYITGSTKTTVVFNELSDNQITEYIDKYKPFDKAGAYGIQELPQEFVKNIDGDLENVIGLSSKSVLNAIKLLEKNLS